MTRIKSLPVEQWDPELRELAHGDSLPVIQQRMTGVYANAPALAIPFMKFTVAMSEGFTLRRRLLELVRLRIAFHNQCRSCMAMRYQSGLDDGVTEDLVCSLERPHEAPDLTDAERSALAYADISATNHFAISDETFADLRKHFSEREIIELGLTIGNFIGFGRLVAAWDMVEELPQGFEDKSARATPWNAGTFVFEV
jgi:AhpD family alkylhydroperoxidase